MSVVLFMALTVVVGFHFGTGACPTHCKAGQTCDADDSGCPECDQAYYGRQCQHRIECRFTAKGQEYRGLRNRTLNGITCQRWDSQSPHKHSLSGSEENYCRNEDNSAGPHCYTIDPSVRWNYCDVKMCSTQCLSPPLYSPGVDVINPPSDGFDVGFNVIIGCMTGYEAPATVTLTCQSDRTWTQTTLLKCNRVQCPSPALAENSQVSNPKSTYKYEAQTVIVCNSGYTLQGQSTLTCQADKTWSPSVPTCKINECPTPASVPNSSVSGSKNKYVYQDTVTITCNTGYTLQGQATMICQADKTWSNAPTCAINECPAPVAIPNSSMLGTKAKYVYQDIVTIKCNIGYTLQGLEQMICQADKTWSSPPSCKIKECPAPASVPNSSLSGSKAKYVYQDTVSITCNTGYTLQGQGTMTCKADKTWSNAPTCAKVRCTQPSVANGKVSNPKSEYKYQDSITIVCNIGHTLQGQSKLTCQTDKTWSSSLPTCIINECPPPDPVLNSSIICKKDKYVYKGSVTIVCDIGYIIAGQKNMHCLANKSLSTALTCEKVKCRHPLLANSKVRDSKPEYEYQESITIVCDVGYDLQGQNNLTCQADASWDNSVPICSKTCNGLSTPQWIGITVGLNLASTLLAIFVTAVIMSRYRPRNNKNDTPSASATNTRNEAFDYDSIDVNSKGEEHVYSLPE